MIEAILDLPTTKEDSDGPDYNLLYLVGVAERKATKKQVIEGYPKSSFELTLFTHEGTFFTDGSMTGDFEFFQISAYEIKSYLFINSKLWQNKEKVTRISDECGELY